jgi:hypothetical protein
MLSHAAILPEPCPHVYQRKSQGKVHMCRG